MKNYSGLEILKNVEPLDKSKYRCLKCRGIGFNPMKDSPTGWELCDKCDGAGELDWLDNVFCGN